MGIRIPIQSAISDALKITGVGASAGDRILQIANARAFPRSAMNVRSGEAINDIIGLNASIPQRDASPPWRGPQGVPPWKAPKAADPRSGVKARALHEESLAKTRLKIKKQRETSAAIAKRRAINLKKNK
jgi:hypothetical protein